MKQIFGHSVILIRLSIDATVINNSLFYTNNIL